MIEWVTTIIELFVYAYKEVSKILEPITTIDYTKLIGTAISEIIKQWGLPGIIISVLFITASIKKIINKFRR